MKALEEINERNRTFWEAQITLFDSRISDPVLAAFAVEEVDSEQRRGVPVYYRKTFETALETAACMKDRLSEQFCHERAKKAGSAPKADTLRKVMEELVATNPYITERQVLQRIKENHDFEVNAEEIAFFARNGRRKSVPITALKDRLSRIKRDTNSR